MIMYLDVYSLDLRYIHQYLLVECEDRKVQPQSHKSNENERNKEMNKNKRTI